jgi:DNA-binding PadR family transcriptional regulator
VYAITDAGREVARQWLRDMLHNTEGQYPEFIAALSILFGLAPEDARAELELRADKLQAALDATEQGLAAADTGLPRLFLLEEEYREAMLEAELSWLRGVIEDLREGRLTWSEEWLRELADKFLPADDQQPEEDR